MKKKRQPYEKKAFESTGSSSDTSANIYESMLLSDAWLALTAPCKALYLVCKSQYYSEKNHPNNNPTQFYMNEAKWLSKYKLYKVGNEKGFYRDMEKLIAGGFISCFECGAATRTRSVYQLSDKWVLYGKPDFKISQEEKTVAMAGWRKGKQIKSVAYG